jgi:hypothetical protein
MNTTLIQKIKDQGMDLDIVNEQLKHFREGFPFLPIIEAATIDNGIKAMKKEELENFLDTYPKKAAEICPCQWCSLQNVQGFVCFP